MSACKIEINNTEYYYPCDYHDSLVLVGTSLINTGSSSVTLYHDFPTYGDNSSGYPRITCPANQRAYIRTSYNATQQNLVVNDLQFLDTRFNNGFLLNIVIVGCLICLLFKR